MQVDSQGSTITEAVPERSSVLIVDDHLMLAEALQRALTARGFRCEVAELGSAEAVVEQAARTSPDLILLDLHLGSIDGLQLVAPLGAAGRVLVVTSCEDHRRLAAAVALGSIGWVAKARPFEELIDAAVSACTNRPMLAPERRDRLVATGRQYVDSDGEVQARMARLTPREREVLAAIVHGDSAQAMSERFVVSVGTVRSHIASVLAKLGVPSQLAAAAVALGWAASKRGLDHEDLLVPLRPSA